MNLPRRIRLKLAENSESYAAEVVGGGRLRADARTIFRVRLSRQEFGNVTRDCRTTKLPRGDGGVVEERTRGLNRLCRMRGIITVANRPENTGPIRIAAKSKFGVTSIS
jgi:hypothetical protein